MPPCLKKVPTVVLMVIETLIWFGIGIYLHITHDYNLWVMLLLANALSGITAVEIIWAKIPRYLTVDEVSEERDSHFPAFRRLDVKYWSRWRAYPGAATLWLFRCLTELLSMTTLAIFLCFSMCGFKVGSKPMTGWRATINKYAYMACSAHV